MSICSKRAVGAPRSKGVKRFAPTEHAMDRTRLGRGIERQRDGEAERYRDREMER